MHYWPSPVPSPASFRQDIKGFIELTRIRQSASVPIQSSRAALLLWKYCLILRVQAGLFAAEYALRGAMAKPRRNVQFQHRGSNHQNGRRPSISEGEGVSEPGSPTRGSMNGKLESSKEEVNLSTQIDHLLRDGPILSSNADALTF